MRTKSLGFGILFLTAAVCLAAAPAPALAQQPTPSVVNTTWAGSEDLAGFGKLTFIFQGNGSAVMVDARSTVTGSWSQNGRTVEIRFANCVYVGTINGTLLSGSAVYTSGPNQGLQWSFVVQKN